MGKKFKPQFDEWLKYLEGLGYTNYVKVLNAKDYGVPQNRERVFVVSILGEHEPYEFPKPIPLDKCITDVLENQVDENYYIDKPSNLITKGHQILIPQATKRGYIELDLPGVCDLSYPTSKTRRGRVQENGKVSPTLTASNQDICYIETQKDDYTIRKLTPKERFRLMGLKDDDIDKIQQAGISNAQQYKMAGNSIVVNVLEGIFRNLFVKK